MERAATGTPHGLCLGCEFFIEASQKEEKRVRLQLNVAHLSGLLAW
ncbi:hypothetical protein Tharo_1534 [Thauera aromatica K172]|uniref:Uncharacterized protein n=1 Tax=Thauera aromatica K172 TaxID=44139 RepID=A0A2R4BMA2_THAAR|nr:hypothetical protein Tharo_1534 [Thauera aromatica K172]